MKFTHREGGYVTYLALASLALFLAIASQYGSRIVSGQKLQAKELKKFKLSLIADYYLSQMNTPVAALNTRRHPANAAFNLKASIYPDPFETNYSRNDLVVVGPDNTVLIPAAGKYIDKNFRTVPGTSPEKLFFVKAFWQIPLMERWIQFGYTAKSEEQLRGHIRVEKILQITYSGNEGGTNPAIPIVEKRMGAERCVTVMGRMYFENPGVDIRSWKGYASCPKGYTRMAGYMVDFEGINQTARRIDNVTFNGVPSISCTSQIDSPWLGSRDEHGSKFVIRTEDGGVDETRSVLPQHWQGREPFSNEPVNTCYALCCNIAM